MKILSQLKANIFLLITFVCVTSQSVWSAEFEKSGSCGAAKVISGDTCSNVKVEFSLAGCTGVKTEIQIAKRIICTKDSITARVQDGENRFEAEFKKVEGWGGITWQSLGDVTIYKKSTSSGKVSKVAMKSADKPIQNSSAHAASNATASVTATALDAPRTTAAASVPSLFKFSGFADLRYSTFNVKNDPAVVSGNPESGFGLEDGAVYVNYEKENVSAVLDVAFRRAKNGDVNSTSTTANASDNNNFLLGADKSQLYLRYKIGSAWAVDFGQFDTIFGVELNDSKDRTFGKTGIVYDYMVPVTHTGAMVEYTKNGFSFKALGANPTNKGSNGTPSTANTGDKTEYGATFGYANDNYHAQVGYLTRQVLNATTVDYSSRSLVDVTAGLVHGAFTLDVEYAQISDPSKNTLTAANNADLESAGIGCFALATYKINDSYTAGLRYEYESNDPGLISAKHETAIGGSLHYKLTSEVELRTEYIGYDIKGVSGNTWSDSRFNVASLIVF